MNYYNYRITEHDLELETETTVLTITGTNILFANIAPISQANHVLTIYGDFTTKEELFSNFEGSFSFSTYEAYYSNQLSAQVNQLYNFLLGCEQNNKVISIYTQVMNDETITEFAQVLNKAEIGLVVKTVRSERNSVIGLLNFLYKEVT